ncbi:hypothetical protein KDA00_04100 [Candidatus Saccharibacteria bacterium]|nr:hypothetical protein [Candidatus Saccharibacteria bacterium]
MKFSELRQPSIHDLDMSLRLETTPDPVYYPKANICEIDSLEARDTDELVIDLTVDPPTVSIESVAGYRKLLDEDVLEPAMVGALNQHAIGGERKSYTPPNLPHIQAQRALDRLHLYRDETPAVNEGSPFISSLRPIVNSVPERPNTDWSQWEKEISEQGVTVIKKNPMPESAQRIKPLPGKLGLILHKRSYMFSHDYFEESGSNVPILSILFGAAKPICHNSEYGQLMGSNSNTSDPLPILRKPFLSTFKDRLMSSRPESKNQFFRKLIAGTVGALALTTALGFSILSANNKEQNENIRNESSGIITENRQHDITIDNINTRDTESFYDWYHDGNPDVSQQEFEEIITSDDFARMCENPEQFAIFAASQS